MSGGMESGWYYARLGGPSGQQVGPVTWADLVGYARAGAFGSDDLVWHEQLGDWQPARQVPGLIAAPVPPAPPAPPAYAPAAGYAAAPAAVAAAPAAYAAPAAKSSKLWYWLGPLIAVIIVGAGLGAYFVFFYHKGDVFAQGAGEILLEPSGVAGPDSFAGEQFVAVGPTTTLKIPNPQVTLPTVSTTAATTATTQGATSTASTAKPATVLVAYPGDTPALYGGSKSRVIADKKGELDFLQKNPAKARAFCEALNSDPTLRWSGGTSLTPADLPAYFEELTPMMLTRDTRVTNYGYKNGHPTPRQSVLQAGQLVLVDRYGVPRKRCECGNPLTPPKPSPKPPVYTGPRWPGFDPTTIIVIQQTTVIIDIFTVIDVNTGQPYGRPSGSDGGTDGEPTTGTTETTQSTETTALPATDTTETTAPPATDTTTQGGGGPVSSSELNGQWSGTFTITELKLPAGSEQAAQQSGCDLSALQALVNQPLNMEMKITVNADGKGGSAVMTLDASALAGGVSSSSNTPQTFTFTLSGDTLTFTVPASSGVGTTMTGTVGRQGQTLVINGVMNSSGQGVSLKCEWQVTKQIAM